MNELRNVAVIHQILSLSHIDLENESVYGWTELTLAPVNYLLEEKYETININCKQCKIYGIYLNGNTEAEFEYCDPSLIKPCNDASKRDLQSLLYQDELGRITVDADEGNGEICIKLTDKCNEMLKSNEFIKLAVEFGIEKPRGGIRFVLENTTGPFMHTLGGNSASLWFPCVQSYNETCTWKLEITVEKEMSVIASGILIETEEEGEGEEKKLKYHYFLAQATCASNIGLVVSKRLELVNDENMSELLYYCEPELKELVRNTTESMHEIVDFYEEILSVQFPFASFKLVFLYDIGDEWIGATSFSSLVLIDVCLLHSKAIIEQAVKTRRVLASVVAKQFFGCFVNMYTWHSWWLVAGIEAFLSQLYLKKLFGNNEYKYNIHEDLKEVCAYEKDVAYILLDLNFSELNKENVNKCHILLKNPLVAPLKYMRVAEKKAYLVIRLIDELLGRELMVQLLHKILSEAVDDTAAFISNDDTEKKFTPKRCTKMSISTESLCNSLSTFSSKDIKPLIELWVNRSGCARFTSTFSFNRKKNTVEIELKQDMANPKGFRKYVGPITIIIQELDGSFTHNLQIEDNAVATKFEIALHSKSKKSKKKKIPLITGEEVDIDTTQMDSDSPILWIRIDPDMKLLREIKFEQLDHQWQYQLRYERDICAQLDALDMLARYPSPQTRATLAGVIENAECFYRVRTQACFALAEVANKMVHTWNGPLPLITTFKKLFMSPSAPNIPSSNNFSNLQMYFLQKNLPIAMGNLRTVHNACPNEVVRFLVDIIRFNENSKNTFSDSYYRACLVEALTNTLTVSIASLKSETFGSKSASLSSELQLVIEEIVLRLNLEQILPTYRYVLTCICLKALRKLQKLGLIPENLEIFKEYTQNNFDDIRIVAYEILVEFLTLRSDESLLEFLYNALDNDYSIKVKHHLAEKMCEHVAAFKPNTDTEILVNRLWYLMDKYSYQYRLKSSLAELYHSMYGFSKPKCLRQIKETLKISESIEAVNLF